MKTIRDLFMEIARSLFMKIRVSRMGITAGILADPYSEDEIADGILKLCRDRALREKLSKDGIERAAGFTWEKGAEILLDVFASLS